MPKCWRKPQSHNVMWLALVRLAVNLCQAKPRVEVLYVTRMFSGFRENVYYWNRFALAWVHQFKNIITLKFCYWTVLQIVVGSCFKIMNTLLQLYFIFYKEICSRDRDWPPQLCLSFLATENIMSNSGPLTSSDSLLSCKRFDNETFSAVIRKGKLAVQVPKRSSPITDFEKIQVWSHLVVWEL